MRYELQIVAEVAALPGPEDLVRGVTARGTYHPRVAASGGFLREEDSPRLLIEEDTGARVLLALERFAHAALLAQQLLQAPEALRRRLGDQDLEALRRANAAFRLSVVQQGADAANAVRFQVQIADVLVDSYGGVLVDPQMQLLWGAERWRAERSLGELEVRRHVVIHADGLEGGVWLHTHGLVKFGKPDIELFGVPEDDLDAAVRLLNQIARHLIAGGEISESDRLDVGAARVAFVAGGAHQPNDFDNACLRVVDDVDAGARPAGAPAALAALR